MKLLNLLKKALMPSGFSAEETSKEIVDNTMKALDGKGTTVIEWERMFARVVIEGALAKERRGEPLTDAQVKALKNFRGED